MRTKALSAVALLVIAIGCASSPGIVQLSPDTYMISKEDHGGIFGSLAKLKADTIREANEFAARQGKVAIPIASKEKPMGICCGQWAAFEYQFRVVDKTDPEVRRASIGTPTAATQTAEVDIESSVANADVYVDGAFVGNAPLHAYHLTAGVHAVEVRARGYQVWKRDLSVGPNAVSRVVAQLDPAQ
jgi:hypothetical protein